MRNYWLPIWLVARRELRDQLRDWRILFPLVLLTLFFPFLMLAGTQQAVTTVNQYGANLVADRMAPFFLMVVGFFPVTISLVVALESFVGEKERGTIEPLLSSPLHDWQMYLGKLLTSITVPLIASYVDITFYLVLLHFQDIALPSFSLILQMLMLTFAHAVLMVSASILISTQSTSVRAANLLASFIIIPVALLIQGETTMIFWGNNLILWLAVLAVLIMTGLLMRVGLSHFRREALIGRELDTINFRWAWQTFKQAFVGKAHSFWSWYAVEIPRTLALMRIPMLILILLAILGIGAGYVSADFYADDIQLLINKSASENGDMRNVIETVLETQELMPTGQITFDYIFLHNVQAVTAMAFFGFFSFSVLGTILFLVNMSIIGAVAAVANLLGFSPGMLLLVGVMPHGIFELPAILIACAVVFYIGALLVTPDGYRSLGEVLLESLAVWTKVMVGIVIPLLIIAALIETNITPVLLANYLKF
jgi:uncharacterized membrane protein SpoIIM required for sporulation/ABC-type transport system involved in multi-copper enzyme maturation permease subunit